MKTERNTGRTKKQRLDAPKSAVYLWPHPNTYDAVKLAAFLGRTDLRIEPPTFLDDGWWHGFFALFIVVDHATRLTMEQWDTLQEIRSHYGTR